MILGTIIYLKKPRGLSPGSHPYAKENSSETPKASGSNQGQFISITFRLH